MHPETGGVIIGHRPTERRQARRRGVAVVFRVARRAVQRIYYRLRSRQVGVAYAEADHVLPAGKGLGDLLFDAGEQIGRYFLDPLGGFDHRHLLF